MLVYRYTLLGLFLAVTLDAFDDTYEEVAEDTDGQGFANLVGQIKTLAGNARRCMADIIQGWLL